MKISFLTTHLNVFGSIRELIENANWLVDFGHDVTIYFDNKTYPFPNWLYCKAKLEHRSRLKETDALIMMDSPFSYNMDIFNKTKAKFKTFVMMGFDPKTFTLEGGNVKLDNMRGNETENNLIHILNNYTICADGQWQLDYFKNLGLRTGVVLGGINTRQFFNYNQKRNIDIGLSGDKRPRKGTHTLLKALESLNIKGETYYNKYDQLGLVGFLNDCNIFIDNHLRAGWCNPVLEAMACGCVVICNDIPAAKDFAIGNETAIVLRDNSVEGFIEAIKRIKEDSDLRNRLTENGTNKAKEFDYKNIARGIEEFLIKNCNE